MPSEELVDVRGWLRDSSRWICTILIESRLPAGDVVDARFRVPAREKTIEVFRVTVGIIDDRSGIRVRENVLAEILTSSQDIVDQPAEKGGVRSGPKGDMDVGKSRRPGEPRIDMNDPWRLVLWLRPQTGNRSGGFQPYWRP